MNGCAQSTYPLNPAVVTSGYNESSSSLASKKKVTANGYTIIRWVPTAESVHKISETES